MLMTFKSAFAGIKHPKVVTRGNGKKRGRPSTNFDKKAYQRQYMADKRQAEKIGVSVREYREAVKNGR